MLRNRKGNKIQIIDTLEPIVPTAEIRFKAKFSLEINSLENGLHAKSGFSGLQ